MGKLDFVQKRVYRVIDTWNYLEERFPDWQLTIVGDVENRKSLKEHTRVLGLKKVSFEEFPLVLAEAMGFGVVPVVYHSFAAAKHIIEDGKDGSLIPYSAKAFPAESMANAITPLMNDKERLQHMAEAAIQKSQLFGIDSIYKQWMKLLN